MSRSRGLAPKRVHPAPLTLLMFVLLSLPQAAGTAGQCLRRGLSLLVMEAEGIEPSEPRVLSPGLHQAAPIHEAPSGNAPGASLFVASRRAWRRPKIKDSRRTIRELLGELSRSSLRTTP